MRRKRLLRKRRHRGHTCKGMHRRRGRLNSREYPVHTPHPLPAGRSRIRRRARRMQKKARRKRKTAKMRQSFPNDRCGNSRPRPADSRHHTVLPPLRQSHRRETYRCSADRCSSSRTQWHNARSNRHPAGRFCHRNVPCRKRRRLRTGRWTRWNSRKKSCRIPQSADGNTHSRRHRYPSYKNHRHHNWHS